VILSAGLSPAWQQILVFDSFRYGQVNRAREALWCSSGKVFNAGIAAHHLGGPSLTLATVGGPPLAEIDREFDELGVPHRWVRTESATRVCTTLLDRSTDTITELVENGRPLRPQEVRDFRRAYGEEAARAGAAVIIGSLPVGTPRSLYRDLMQATPCPAVLDFRGEGLLSVLDHDADLLAAMQSLNGHGARWVVVTQGGGPVWLTSDAKIYRLHPLPVEKLVNPIACGDAMAATIAWATRQGRDIVDAVRLGMAAAAENLRQLLPARIDPQEVMTRAEQVRVEELSKDRGSAARQRRTLG
jgi:tagatose 6-phosphate kinase